MKKRPPAWPGHLVQGTRAALDRWLAPHSGVTAVVVATPDGFEIASLQAGSLDLSRLATTASSLMAMARAVGREVACTQCTRLVFEAEEGIVVVQPVPAKFPSLLCVVLAPGNVLGGALWRMDKVSAQLRTID